ncbi:MAG TPA: hypothetical protein VMG35_15655 [Bryobacteraceae bacterium]|nr:hypothetical protein [Bryobacteraceae bacterium]
MPSPILHAGAEVLCSHGGQATPSVSSPRVTVSGMAIATIAAPYLVSGCSFVSPGGNGPCVSAMWESGAARVESLGQPVAVMTGSSTCAPTGTPLRPMSAQTRVAAS